jgi:RHS repeat-associated protein
VLQERATVLDAAGQATTTNSRSIWGAGMPGGIGALLGRHVGTQHFHYHYDGRGNVVQITSANPGQLLRAVYGYNAFGELTYSLSGTQYTQEAQPFRFSTKLWNERLDLYHFGARFYDPSLGRFINRDPIREAGGLNLYGFVGNNPINQVDPWGLMYAAGFDPEYGPTNPGLPGYGSPTTEELDDPLVYAALSACLATIGGDYGGVPVSGSGGGRGSGSGSGSGGGSASVPAYPSFPEGTVFRSGAGNRGNFVDKPGRPPGISVRTSLSEPWPQGPHGPVFNKPEFTAVDPARYGGCVVDNKPPGHANLPGLSPEAMQVPGKIGTYKFPK